MKNATVTLVVPPAPEARVNIALDLSVDEARALAKELGPLSGAASWAIYSPLVDALGVVG